MKHTFCDGAIVCQGKLHEKAKCNVSNEKISAIFDGCGCAVGYAEADAGDYFSGSFCTWYINGTPVDMLAPKEVKMLGRKQTVTIETSAGVLKAELFLDKSSSGIFAVYEVLNRKDNSNITVGCTNNNIKKLRVFSDGDVKIVNETSTVYFNLPCGVDRISSFLTYSDIEEFNVTERYAAAQEEMRAEMDKIILPENLNEMEKALFYSSYFCALENFKVKGDYRCFMAGHRYLLPMRTYYRDSYYTVLPMYNGNVGLVKDQIITLIKGVSEDGTCPSAVKADYSAFWGNHYDSPSLLIVMLYDYIHHTKDNEFLNAQINGITVYEKAKAVIKNLSAFADGTGLIYKEGLYNMRDWADEVCRIGYVTYNEVLYARALYCLSEMAKLMGNSGDASYYEEQYNRVKNAINQELWDEELGYYINYKSSERTEKNLSVDTVFAAIWGIADHERSIRMLKNMEALLESKNNPQVQCRDFGVLCVYPFYSGLEATYNKSTQPYNYHNGANWPYWSAIYAYAKRKFGMEYKYALESWFEYNIERGNYTPIEYFSPLCEDGSLLQAWSAASAFVLDEKLSLGFWD